MCAKKSDSVTFRIDEKYDKVLRKIADEQKISLNTLVNHIFGNYVETEVYLQKFGTLKLSTDSFRRILAVLDDKTLYLQSVTDFIKIFFNVCGFGRYDVVEDSSKVVLSAHHDLKEKGSLYIKYFLESLIRTSLDKSCKTTITEDSVTIEFQS